MSVGDFTEQSVETKYLKPTAQYDCGWVGDGPLKGYIYELVYFIFYKRSNLLNYRPL